MADNFVANPGSGGATFASDDISSVQYPRVKSGWGADGAYNDPSVTAPFPIQIIPGTADGCDLNRIVSTASTNATTAKSSAGTVYAVFAFNVNAAKRYLKFYNKASTPTVGTDIPVATFPLPPSDAGFILSIAQGIKFSTGIGMAITTGYADNDTGAVAANEIFVHTFYK